MSLDADHIVDRRRMRRKLTLWRVLTVVLAAVVLVGGGLLVARPSSVGTNYIARIEISGLIRSDSERVEALERLAKSSSARAVIVRINSPGGTTSGAEQLYDALVRLKAAKPMVVVVEGLGASGGYIAAMASDHIVAQSSALVGSIGVLFQYPNVYELLKLIGVKVEEVKSSPLKAAPNGYEPTSPEARAALEAIVMDSYSWFRNMVRDRRGMDEALLTKVADGRVFTGRQGIELKLIDEIGEEKAAIAWLAKEKGIDANLPVRDYKLNERLSDLSFLRTASVVVLDAVGLGAVARRIEQSGTAQAIDRLNLDGLLALWHPPAAN